MDKTFCTSNQAAKLLNIHPNTLRSWEENNIIQSFRSTEKGHRRYNIQEFLDKRIKEEQETLKVVKKNICYCRVSSRNQKEELKNQIEYLKSIYPNHEIITDIASGLNYKRKGLQRILDYANQGLIAEIVVTYKDRLCRFGFELVEYVINSSGGQIVVLNQLDTSPQEEMVKDLTSIIHIFSCRLYGLRRYKKTIKEASKS
jgi:predicted site-specific integrase-resolvase